MTGVQTCALPIFYGCGDFLSDYEGIEGHGEFRPELGCMYFVTMRLSDRTLSKLELVPTRVRRMRIERASKLDAKWIRETLARESAPLGTRIEFKEGARLLARAA